MAKKNSSIDLSGIDLSGINLDDIDVDNIKVEDSKEEDIDLSGVDLSNINLDEVDVESIKVDASGKKKAQEGESQEGMESSSEDIFSGSPSLNKLTEEDERLLNMTEYEALSLSPKERYKRDRLLFEMRQEVSVPTPSAVEKQIQEEEEGRAEKRASVLGSVPYDLDYLKSPEEILEKLPEDLLNTYNDDFLIQGIREQRYNKLEDLATEALNDSIQSYTDEFIKTGADKNKATQLAKEKVKTNLMNKEIDLLGLSEEQVNEYAESIFELDELMSSPERNEERILELLDRVKELTKISDKRFIDPKTGKIDTEKKEEIENLATEFSNEYSNDYTKLKERLDKEVLKADVLSDRLEKVFGGSKSGDIADRLYNDPFLDEENFLEISIDPSSKIPFVPESSELKEAKELYQDYVETKKKSEALSRALLLNEDVFATSKGFQALDGIPILEEAGEAIVSGAEAFVEALPGGIEVLSDNDYAQYVSQAANESGIELKPEQVERAEVDFSQKLGSTIGTSLEIGLEIAAFNKGLGVISKAVNAPKLVARAFALKDFSKAKKTMKAVRFIENLVKEDLAFQLASEDIGVGTGAAEKLTEDGLESLVKKISGSKYGSFLKYLDNYVTRSTGKVAGRTVGGTTAEYAGEFVAEGIDKGFFTDEQFKSVFGEGEEAVEKFILTASMTGIMAAPTTFISEVKKKNPKDSEVYKLAEQTEEYNKIKEKVKNGKLTEEEKAELQEAIDKLSVEDVTEGLGDVSEEALEESESISADNAQVEEETTEQVKEEVTEGVEEEVTEGVEETKGVDEEVTEGVEETEGDTFDKRTQETVAQEIQEVEEELSKIEIGASSVKSAVLESFEKIDPESAKRETGAKVGVGRDISPSLTKKGGKSVEALAEDLYSKYSSQADNGGTINATEMDFKDAIIEVLQEPSLKEARSKFTGEGRISELNRRKQELEEELESLRPKEFEELSVEDQNKILEQEFEEIESIPADEVVEEDKLQSYYDYLDKLDKKINSNIVKSDFGLSAAVSAIIKLAKAGLKAGMTLRDAINKAKSDYQSTEDYKNLSDSEKKELLDLEPESIEKQIKKSESDGYIKDKSKEQIKKEAQKEFTDKLKKDSYGKDSQGNTFSKLSPAKRTVATNLVNNIKDKKSLELAKKKLDNLLKTGKKKPTTSDIVNAKPDEFTTLKTGELNSRLLKAEKSAAKNLSKEKGRVLAETFRKLRENKAKLTEREIKSLVKDVMNSDPASIAEMEALNNKIDEAMTTSEKRKQLNQAKSLQSKLKREIKKKKHKDGFGKIKEKAKELANLNPRYASSTEVLIDVLEAFNNSISKGEGTLESVRDMADIIIKEASDIAAQRKLEREALIEEQMKEEFQELKDQGLLPPEIKDYEDYVEFLNDLKDEKSLELSEEKKANLLLNLVDKIDALSDFKQGDTFKNMTPKQKGIVNTLLKAQDVLTSEANMSVEQLLMLNNAINEILTYDSTSGTAKASAIIEGVKKGLEFKKNIFGNMQESRFSKEGISPNLSSFLAAITTSPESAKKLGSIMFGEYNSDWNKVSAKAEAFDVESGRKRRDLKLKDKNSTRIGLISDLRQTPEGVDATKDLENKKKHIKEQIAYLKKQGTKKYNRLAADLQKNYNELGLDEITSKDELLGALTKNEAEYLTWVESKFAEILPELQEAYRNQTGKELETVENYAPTYVTDINRDAKDRIPTNEFSVDPSGRTVKRVPTLKGSQVKNYDIFRTSLEGYKESFGDIYTLGDREVIKQMMKSKPFKEAVGTRPDGKQPVDVKRAIQKRVKMLIDKRTVFNPDNIVTYSKRARLAKQYAKGSLVLPLKTRGQVLKQPISIVANSIAIAPNETAEAFAYFSLDTMNKFLGKSDGHLDALLKFSNVSMRTTQGDTQISDSKLLSEQTYNAIERYLNEGKPLPNKSLNEIKKALGKGMGSSVGKLMLNNDVIGTFDRSAAGGSWLAFYMKERRKQEGKGFKFDLEKESKNPNMEAVEKANIESDWVNNKSDYTTQGDAFYQKGLAKYLFLFKSFSLNQNINAMINSRNLAQAIKRKDWKVANQSLSRLGGSLASAAIFNGLKAGVLKLAYDEIMEAFGLDPEDEETRKGIDRISAEAIGVGFVDMFLGGAPEFATLFMKSAINDMVVESAKEDFEDEWEGISEKPSFNPYDYKLFYDNYQGEGTLAAYTGMIGDLYQNAEVMAGLDGGVESEGEMDDPTFEVKASAFLSTLGLILGEGDLKKFASMYKRKRIKQDKEEAKAFK